MHISKKVSWFVVTGMAVLMFFAAVCFGAAQTADTVTVLKAEKLSCGSCAAKITKALEAQQGVASVDVDIEAGKVTVWHASKAIDAERLASVVTDAGYPSGVYKTADKEAFEKETGKAAAVKQSFGSGCGCCNQGSK
ncbi:heavy-metal-associated domain-containing protein [Geobacter sp. DSM 9736]|uniref:heavy-metal-associated domain-containing protein n=1 Tax=Geobacter sp. DSM 9736 TaxID=1277350 RepID=UPI000B50F89F|nr:heavy-metal-associated domain-containing protein [Geobacter sp. DSM 9736]SNB45390.1 Copper chaperone CopZ [Geobacter sp. DSM 9736]